MREFAEAEADALDPFDQIVDGLGRPVRHERFVPREDLLAPTTQGSAEGADFGRHRVVGHVSDELVEVFSRDRGVVEIVETAQRLLSDNRPSVPVVSGSVV